jgi:hypothetical protein
LNDINLEIAKVLGRPASAGNRGKSLQCATVSALAMRCHGAASKGSWPTTVRRYAGPRLLIIDEAG